ncbi:MAG: hypothetical protein H8E87_01065 [FCB group bacterium]|nr:hypothetical protein [FCB group bacterium]
MKITKKDIEERNEKFRRFNQWEEQNPPQYSPETAIHLIGCLYEMLPPEVRMKDDDPEKLGIRKMHSILKLLSCDDICDEQT